MLFYFDAVCAEATVSVQSPMAAQKVLDGRGAAHPLPHLWGAVPIPGHLDPWPLPPFPSPLEGCTLCLRPKLRGLKATGSPSRCLRVLLWLPEVVAPLHPAPYPSPPDHVLLHYD